jgi:hypothetical protein
MFGISSPHLDVRVTGGHTMIVRGRSSTSKYWQKQDADQVANRSGMFTIPVSAESYEKPAGLTDDEIRFIGWVLTDGTVNTKTRQAIISQSASKTAHCEAIRSVIRGCGFKFSEYRIKRAGPYAQHADNVMFCVSYGPPRGKDKHLRGYGEKLAVWLDKSIPECFDKLNDRQVGILLEAMNMGDGVNGRKTITWTPRTMTITCGDNKRMADRLQAILVCRGYRCNQSVLAYDGKRPWYYLHIKKIQYSTIAGIGVANGRVSGRKPYERSRFEQVDSTPGELVWCITNELGTLVTRRNGKVAIVGNCGRALRPMAGKERAVILDHVGNVLTHGLPDEDRAWSLDGEEKRKKKKKDKEEAAVRVQQCKSCYAIFEAGAPACTACGTPVPVPKGREVKQTDGELRELTQADRLKLRRTQNQEVGRAKTLEELERIAEARGYKKGWAKHVYEARTKRSEWTAGLDANAP